MTDTVFLWAKKFGILPILFFSFVSFSQYCEKSSPYTETFSGDWRDCWREITTGSGDALERVGLFKSYDWEEVIMISPKLSDFDNNKYIELEFAIGPTQFDEFEIGTMGNPYDDTTYTPYEKINYRNATFISGTTARVRISFTRYTGNHKFIAFRGTKENRRISFAEFSYGTIEHCDYIRGLQYSNVTPTSISLSWQSEISASDGYRIAYDGQVVETTSTEATITALAPDSSYTFKITGLCDLGESDPRYIQVKTPCNSSPSEYQTDFQDADFASYECWSVRSGGDDEIRFAVDVGRNDSRGVRMVIGDGYEDNGGFLISPRFENLDGTKEITFWMRKFIGHSYIEVGTLKNPDDLHSFTHYKTFESTDIGPGGWQNYSVSFEGHDNDHRYIAIRQGNANRHEGGRILLDDFNYRNRLACERPQNITMENTGTNNGIILSWDDDGATEWEIEYGGNAFDLGTGIRQTVSSPNFTINNLEPNKNYEAYIRKKCADGSFSDWSSVYRFYSGCLSSFTVGYSQNFDSGFDNCWNYVEFPESGRSYYSEDTNIYRGGSGQSIKLTNGSSRLLREYIYLVSPRFSDMDANKKISFYLNNLYGDFQVGTMENPNDESTFKELESYIRTEGSLWEKKTVQLNAGNGNDKYIAFRFRDAFYSGSNTVNIDDFSYEESADCFAPENVIVTEITDASAKVSWTPVGDETAWEISYSLPLNLNPNYVEKIIVNEPNYHFEELLSNYSYKFYVRALCDPEGHHLSEAVGPYNFETDCGSVTVNYEQDFNGDPAPSNEITNNRCWSFLSQITYPANGWTELTNKHQREVNDYNTIFEVENFTDETLNLLFISPELIDFGADKLISFELYVRDEKLNFEVGTLTDPTDIDSFEVYETIVAENMSVNDWKEFTVDFENYTGNAKHVAFRPVKNLNHFLSAYPHDGSISIDNFRYFNDDYVIKGTVRNDSHGDGCDPMDLAIPNVKIKLEDTDRKISRFSNREGTFDFYPTAGNYTVSPEDINPYFSFFPGSANVNLDAENNLQEVDFCLKPNGVHPDLQVALFPNRDARPGFDTSYTLVYENVGTTVLSGAIDLQYDAAKLTFLNAEPNANNNTSSSLSWFYENLNPFEKRSVTIKFNVAAPPTTNIGEELVFVLEGTHGQSDESPENNTFVLNQTIIGSYDPNDKTVLEGSKIAISEIDDYLHYVVRFQNTGTASAITVRIADVLDPNLDWSTFYPLEMSHVGTVQITDDNFVEFIFEDIDLPPESLDEEGSNGFVSFKIKPKATVTVGTIISGQAEIYFDFNPPIITNEVVTEVVDELPLAIESTTVNTVSCHGAADGSITVLGSGGTEPYTYEIYNTFDDSLLSTSDAGLFDGLSPGSYHVRLIDASSVAIQSDVIDLAEPPVLAVTVSATQISCEGSNDASAVIMASGGTPTYQYSIDSITYVDSNVFENLSVGSYSGSVRDSNGCEANFTFTIESPEAISATVSTNQTGCFDNDGVIMISASGGTAPLSYSIDGVNFSSIATFENLTSGTYEVFVRDANGCTVMVTIVLSQNPDCNTFTLPTENFTVRATGETCASSDNGSILLTAVEELNYVAALSTNGTLIASKNFRTFTSFQELGAGSYDVCISIVEEPEFERCFSLEITEPEPLSVDSSLDSSDKFITLRMRGGESYTIVMNGQTTITTENEITLPVSAAENQIEVKTDKECQGVFSDSFVVGVSKIIAYPNPVVNGKVTVTIPTELNKNPRITVYASSGKRILEQIDTNGQNSVQLDVNGLPSGVYTLKIETALKTDFHRIIIN